MAPSCLKCLCGWPWMLNGFWQLSCMGLTNLLAALRQMTLGMKWVMTFNVYTCRAVNLGKTDTITQHTTGTFHPHPLQPPRWLQTADTIQTAPTHPRTIHCTQAMLRAMVVATMDCHVSCETSRTSTKIMIRGTTPTPIHVPTASIDVVVPSNISVHTRWMDTSFWRNSFDNQRFACTVRSFFGDLESRAINV